MSSVPKVLLTPEEYLARERKAEFRSEYYRGETFAMAGASWEHTLIKDNLSHTLRIALGESSCRVVTSDLRVKVSATGLYTYPDVLIVCDEPRFEDGMFDTLLNPRVIMEVLSEFTAGYDRGDKFKHYRQITSLQEYVLVAQDEAYLERHVRQPNGGWLMSEFQGLERTLELTSVPVKIEFADIYRGVEFSEKTDQ